MSDGEVKSNETAARQRAVEAAIRAHDRMLVRWLARKFGDMETARDIAQSAYLRVWRHAETQIIQNPQALLFKTAANLAANEFRARKRMRAMCMDASPSDDDYIMEIPAQLPSPESEIDSKRQLAASMAAIDALPAQVRRAFVMSRFEDMNYRQIARALGVSESSVEKYIIQALRALRTSVEDREKSATVVPFARSRRSQSP